MQMEGCPGFYLHSSEGCKTYASLSFQHCDFVCIGFITAPQAVHVTQISPQLKKGSHISPSRKHGVMISFICPVKT